jgi:cyclohexadienyl dehydratase
MRRSAGVLVALTLAGGAAAAEPSRFEAILSSHVLRVGTTGDYPPFASLDKQTGQYSGLDIDLAKSLGAALGATVTFVPTTWPTLTRDLKSGAFDIAMGGVSVTLERQKSGFFSAPYLKDGKTPIARCADQTRYQTLADIDRPGVRVIANPGGTNERFDRARLHSAEILVHPDNLTIFDAVAKGEADLMITDASETRFQQKTHPGVLCAIHPDKPFDVSEKAYWMAPDPALKAFVDQWLHLSAETGELSGLEAKWFGEPKPGP